MKWARQDVLRVAAAGAVLAVVILVLSAGDREKVTDHEVGNDRIRSSIALGLRGDDWLPAGEVCPVLAPGPQTYPPAPLGGPYDGTGRVQDGSAPAPSPVAKATVRAAGTATLPASDIEQIIREEFGALGLDGEYAIGVARCEDPSLDPLAVGGHGERGIFQLHPRGAGARFIERGWDLFDARTNVRAAATYVEENGWGAWKACAR